MYVTDSYYRENYGGEMPTESFMRNEQKAEAYIRNITYIRGDIFSTETDAIKDAVCAVADVFRACECNGADAGTGVVKSENTDGYSVTYVVEQSDGQTREELIRKKAYDAAYLYLLPTGWLSRRVTHI